MADKPDGPVNETSTASLPADTAAKPRTASKTSTAQSASPAKKPAAKASASTKAPAKTPAKTRAKTSAKPAAKSATKSATKVATKSPAKRPAKTATKTAAKSPAKSASAKRAAVRPAAKVKSAAAPKAKRAPAAGTKPSAPVRTKKKAAAKPPAPKKASAAKKPPASKQAPASRKAPTAKKAPASRKALTAKKAPASKKAVATKPSNLAATAASLLNPMTPVKAYANLAGKVLNRLVKEQKATPAQIIREIEKGPKGPQVVAAFDFDGTLIGGYSGAMLYKERQKRKEVSRDEVTESFTLMFKIIAKMVEANEMVARAFARWEGKSEAEMEELSNHIYENAIQDSVFPEMREILDAHRKAGHTLVVATSASRYQAEPAVTALGIDKLLCTELEVKDGKLTGKIAGENLFGAGKAAAIAKFVEEQGASLENTHFYADGSEEVGLMQSVGHPRPVNPGSKLLEAAKDNRWPVLRLGSRGSAKPGHFIRTLAGVASIGPILQTGLAVGAITQDKRAFANTVMPAWINSNMRLAGVKMKVSGRQHLWSRRPAVFVFNHRNYYDGMIAAALVKTDYAAIARKEMGENAIGKLIQKIMPTILIDRGSGSARRAAQSLQPVVDAMQNDGYSVMLSPEGTRTKGRLNSVGPFKKGAFHMAMAAGVPVVPIVIRNALDIAAHGQGAMRPGTIDVRVLPPISMDDWTRQNMEEKIEQVRQMYIDTLSDWPAADADA